MQVYASFSPVECQGAEAPSEILYLPKGRNTISATLGGKSQTLDVEVDASTAAQLSEAFATRQASPVRPHFDFDHKGSGPASAIPTGFRWDESRGVMASLEWTGAGAKALNDRDYSFFSPTFLVNDKGRPYGFPKSGAIGALVNEPAFREIGKLAASNSPNPINMKFKPFELAGILTAAQAATDETAIPVLLAFLQDKDAKLKTAKASLKEASDKLEAAAELSATETVERLVKAGKVTEEKKDEAKAAILANPSFATLLEGGDKTPDVTKQVVKAGAKTPEGDESKDQLDASRTRERAMALVGQGVPYSVAWNRAQVA